MNTAARRAVLIGLCLASGSLSAQMHTAAVRQGADAEAQAFVESAREATARFQARDAAIAAGYRLLGPDFPGMGEHWIHLGLMVGGRFDAAHPQVLCYAEIDGRPTLVGLAYALPLEPGETPPDFPRGAHGAQAWHHHSGSVAEESVPFPEHMSGAGGSAGVRLAMMHAWVWLPNPDGTFAADNWALPFVRAGLAPPADAHPAAARALSLISGGDAYYLQLFRTLADPSPSQDRKVRAVLARFRGQVAGWLGGRAASEAQPHDAELFMLSDLWTRLWTEIGATLEPESAARLREVVLSTHASSAKPR